MPFDTTILVDKIEKIKKAYESGEFGDILVAAVNTGNGLMQQRIFTDTVDTEGNSFGPYIGKKVKVRLTRSGNKTTDKRLKNIAGQELTPYQRKRAAAGRQVLKKDLEFTGDLRRSINTALEEEKAAVLSFNTDHAARVARGQENQITNIRNGITGTTKGDGIKIFKLNDSEKEQVVEQGQLHIIELLNRK